MLDLSILKQSPRLLIEAELRPAQGERFQPTGFADIGAATYQMPDADGKKGTPMLLVESAQSVANRFEKTCLKGDGPELDEELSGLPYVIAKLQGSGVGEIVTSSLVEAHRLGSPYFIKNDEFKNTLSADMEYDPKGQVKWNKVYKTFFKYDPNCLIHGVFLSLLEGGRVRVPRALSGFIEARNVSQVQSGGVKNSPVDPKGEIQVDASGAMEKGIYSNVPYSRTEFVAEKITAYFHLDTLQIRSYGLGENATQLLIALSLLKIRRFLDSALRLRTACVFDVVGKVKATKPAGFVLPNASELLGEVQRLILECKPNFADPAVTVNTVAVKKVTKKTSEKESAA